MTKYLENTVAVHAPLGANAPADLHRTEAILSFEEVPEFGRSGKHYTQGWLEPTLRNVDTVEASQEAVKVTTASGSRNLPISYPAFRSLFNQTAEGEIVDTSEETLSRLRKNAALRNDSLAQKALKVGDHLRDGTVVIAVDLKKNEALFAPAGIFGGKASFDKQHEIPAQFSRQNEHGHSDWRNITDDEGKTLADVWDKVAPAELKGSAAPFFWFASSYGGGFARARRGGEANWNVILRDFSLSVPCVRSGPAVG